MTETVTEPGLSRRGAVLECMRWAGASVIWTVVGGIPRGHLTGDAHAQSAGFSFAQISDSHIGFARDPNLDTPGTFQAGCDQIRALAQRPAFLIHTGDVSHLSKPGEFDTAAQIMASTRLDAFTVPGEHDVLDEATRGFAQRFQKRQPEGGYFSFDQQGVHFVGLNNVGALKAGGMGSLGEAQLAWLEADLKGRAASQPIVLFAHIPLWTVAAEWGWGTEDSARALALVARFGSVTVLNGHIHQIIQKVEGNVAFHTARSTAFPQPAPGSAPSPGPMKVPAGQLRSVLGVASVSVVPGTSPLAIIDSPLGA
jgi:3',5'-cyclic AMP phosphodiesterase CpdA